MTSRPSAIERVRRSMRTPFSMRTPAWDSIRTPLFRDSIRTPCRCDSIRTPCWDSIRTPCRCASMRTPC
ncbi:hypothetical protein D5S17_22395 [Pseudonocardiaceae bacterium YIM PH 21723]|nr:hypothetical protein D5S17_22395 [Pseudonocardiaceae bacterium YIM PH 21723]